MSHLIFTIRLMDNVVDLAGWRNAHRSATPDAKPKEQTHRVEGIVRLERAADHLHRLVTRSLDGGRRLEPHFETELLAIIGEVTIGLVREAAARAERLAGRLEAREAGNTR
ncbi:MAG TPA: hypothetical protein VHI54_04430 [Actinomycetota bacterium]|nr:hypothetical protein [Actinomycetota bacterium]